jgi:hypothetical protein
MNRDTQKESEFHPEQSWIVLDEGGWGNSRPPTASPTRPSARDDDEDLESRIPRRIAMDRDVREALELAERSLEMAGTLDEFSLRSNRGNSDDDNSTVRSSPANKSMHSAGGIFVDDVYEDKYNGRGPPTIIGNRRGGGIVIATDAEHIAFQNIKMMGGPRPDTPLAGNNPSCSSSSSSPSSTTNYQKANPLSWSQDSTDLKRDDDEGDLSFLQWAFGISASSNFVPLVFSHVVTLLVGFYIGSRRSSSSSSSTTASVNITPSSPQCTTSGAPA